MQGDRREERSPHGGEERRRGTERRVRAPRPPAPPSAPVTEGVDEQLAMPKTVPAHEPTPIAFHL